MLESTKNKIKSRKIVSLAQITIIILSLIGFLICQFAVGKDNLGFAPIWMLFIISFLGNFVFYFVSGIIKKSVISIMAGGVSGVVGLEIILFLVANIKYWYVWVVIGLLLFVILFVSTFFFKAESLEIEYDNAPDSGRKSYAEKMAEKTAEKNNAKNNTDKEVSPEIKSFKD